MYCAYFDECNGLVNTLATYWIRAIVSTQHGDIMWSQAIQNYLMKSGVSAHIFRPIRSVHPGIGHVMCVAEPKGEYLKMVKKYRRHVANAAIWHISSSNTKLDTKFLSQADENRAKIHPSSLKGISSYRLRCCGNFVQPNVRQP